MNVPRDWPTRSRSMPDRLFMGLLAALLLGGVCLRALPAEALREFTYRELNLTVVRADGRPMAGASVYGFCRELNLLWPRIDTEVGGRNDLIWHQSCPGKTGANGSVKVTVPPGKWGFFAAGRAAGGRGTVVAAWTDFREWQAGEKIRLTPTVRKKWTFCSPDGAALALKRVFLRPEGFPIWIPVGLPPGTESLGVEMIAGGLQVWGTGDAPRNRQGFALSWGTVNEQTPEGKLLAPEKAAVIECRGGGGRAALSWFRSGFGLEGEIALSDEATVLMTPGAFTLAYRRPVAEGLMGDFVRQSYNLEAGGQISFTLDGPLQAGVQERLWPPDKKDTKGQARLCARLYLVDGTGHLMAQLLDASGKPATFGATVVLNGERFTAKPVPSKTDVPGQGEAGQTMFTVNVGAARTDAGAVWKFTAPPGILSESELAGDQLVTVTSQSFQTEVPKLLERHAQNLLGQLETLAQAMENVTDRKRQRAVTLISIQTGRGGAGASHSGAFIGIGTKLFYSDRPILRHDTVHELGHNFGLTHGGLHETVVEATRCAGNEQISQQMAKWMFFDYMNGIARKEVGRHNTGLYMYCYAQGGPAFLRFMLANEYAVRDRLAKEGYTADEVAAALCGLALGRDITPICRAYGLEVSPERVAQVKAAAQALCQTEVLTPSQSVVPPRQ